MAKFLLTVQSTSTLAAARDLASPPDYLVECQEHAAALSDQSDGLERWSVELQIAGAVADWAAGPAYDAFWAHLEAALQPLDVRPRAVVSIHSHTDARRIGITFSYLGDHELERARDGIRQRIGATLDPASKRLKADLELRF